MRKKLRGTGVALVTPFRNDDSVDFKALNKLVENVIEGGVEYLVVMGTTGEAATLNSDEKLAVLNYVQEVNNGRLPIVLGIGGNNTQNVVNTIKNTDFSGVDAILSVAPYYNKPIQKGLYIHYKMIASASPLPIILYNVPGRTSINIDADTIIKLAEDFENIIAVKEASGNFTQIMEIVKNKPKDFIVLSGDDSLTMPLVSAGVEGVISVTANALPREFSDMVRASLKSNFKSARELHYKILDFMETIFVEGNPGGIKAALNLLDITTKYVRLPLASVSKATYNRLSKILEEIKK